MDATTGGGSSQDENGNPSMYQVATPEISPNGGTYTSAQTVTITCATEDAAIYYTINGDKPSTSSTKYTGQITVNKTTTVRAIAYKEGWEPSEEVQANYTIEGTVSYPTFTPKSGTFNEAQTITITCTTPGATIYYTDNGSEPSTSSTKYTGSFSIDKTTTVRAIAYKDGNTSEKVTANYKFAVTKPTITPPDGSIFFGNGPETISISCATPGATIRYTDNGTTPTNTNTNAKDYTNPFTIGKYASGPTRTVKANASKDGYTLSSTETATYTFLTLHGTIKINNKEVNLPESDYILQGTTANPTLKWVWGDGKNPYLEMNQYNGTSIQEGTLKNITIKVRGDSTLNAGASGYALSFSQGVHIEGSTSGKKLTLKNQYMRVVVSNLTAKNINLTIEGNHTVNPEWNATYVILGNIELQDKAILNLTGYRDWSEGGAGGTNAHAIYGIDGTLTLKTGSSANINVTGHEYTTSRMYGVKTLILDGGDCNIQLSNCPLCVNQGHPQKAVENQPTVPGNYNTTGAWDSNYVKYTRE